jgi:hypothetical protein
MYQLISYFIMAKNGEATFLATKSVLQGELGFTTIVAFWKVGWSDAVLHEEGIAELLGGEFSPIDGGRTDSQAPVCSPLLMVWLCPSGKLCKVVSNSSVDSARRHS